MDLVITRYLHFIFIFAIISSVVAEHLLIKEQMTRKEIKRMSVLDAIYGFAAIGVLAVGFYMWFYTGKTEFYGKNPIFHTKITLFVVVGLLSIKPTIFFLKQRKGNPDELVAVPKSLKMFLRLELLLLFVIPLLAVLMAKGYGL